MALILTSRTPWRRRPSGVVVPNAASPLVAGATLYDHQLPGSLMARAGGIVFPHLSAGDLGIGMHAQSDAGDDTYWSDTSATHGNTITLAMWLRFVRDPGTPYLVFSKRADWSSADGFGLWTGYNGTDWVFSVNSTRAGMVSGTAVAGNTYHVVGTYDQQNVRLYVNGVQLGATALTAAIGTNASVLRFGTLKVSEIIVYAAQTWPRALSDAEIWALYAPDTRWSIYAPLVVRRYFDLGGAGGPSDLACDAGAYTVTGFDASLTRARLLTCDAGSYTLTGNAATLTKASALAPDAGSYTVAGNTTTLTVARILTCDAGSYTLTGNAVTLTKASVLLPAAGAYTLTGNDATLTYQQAGSLTCDVGTYTVTGFDTTLTVARLLTANTGDYTTTGLDVTFTVGTTLICDSGNYTVTGFDPTLLYIRSLPATTGAYTVTGQAVTLLYSGAPVEDTDYSEYIFGQGSDPVSTLSIDLLPNDDGVSSLSISLGD